MPEAEVIMITGYGDVKTAVEAIKQGAANYLTKPADLAELRAIVEKASERMRINRATGNCCGSLTRSLVSREWSATVRACTRSCNASRPPRPPMQPS